MEWNSLRVVGACDEGRRTLAAGGSNKSQQHACRRRRRRHAHDFATIQTMGASSFSLWYLKRLFLLEYSTKHLQYSEIRPKQEQEQQRWRGAVFY
jgi:hypothetical protein